MTKLDPKDSLRHYLQQTREVLLWKMEGVSERELRQPRTPTGMNLLGIVKHAASTEIGYFGDTFGREWPTINERVTMADLMADPQSDWYATAEESATSIIDFYRRVWAFADATITELPLSAPGQVPWWGDRGEVTLHQILVHVVVDLARHAGHADIVREGIDGAAGLRPEMSNLPDQDWSAYTAKLTRLAQRF